MKHLISTAAILIALAGTQAMAAGAKYSCEIKGKGQDGFVAPKMLIEMSADRSSATIYDGYIHNTHGKPITVKAAKMSEGKYRIKWDMLVETSNEGDLPITYTLRFNEKRQTYTINGFLHGFDNRIGGSGTCQPVK
jgi:hypothetical protein